MVAEGSDVVLVCTSTDDEPLNYQWMRVSGSLPKNAKTDDSGQRLTIHNITVNDSGKYYCTVNINESSTPSMKVQVTARSESLIINRVMLN